ncbi:MAG: hypothetical protein Kow0056_09120 [Coriobacteriia bacterium]
MVLGVAILVALVALPLAGCGKSGGGGNAEAPSPPAGQEMTDDEMLAEALKQLYPGFEFVEFLGSEDGAYFVAARRETVPEFIAKIPLYRGAEEEDSVLVGGYHWTVDDRLREAADDASLLTGSLQTQTLESIAQDAGLAGGQDGRYVTEISTVSNMELRAVVEEPDGQYSSYTYKLDIMQSPSRFVLESKSENRAP